MFIVTKKESKDGNILVVTDKDIIGKCYTEENKQLDLTSKFYEGEEMNEEQVIELIDKYYILHLTGDYSVDIGIKLRLVDEDKIIIISGIKHAECLIDKEA